MRSYREMQYNILEESKRILEYANKLSSSETYYRNIISNVQALKNRFKLNQIDERTFKNTMNSLLQGQNYNVLIQSLQEYKTNVLNNLRQTNANLFEVIERDLKQTSPTEVKNIKAIMSSTRKDHISEVEVRRFKEYLRKKELGAKKINLDYSIYSSNPYARTSNQFADKLSYYLINKYPEIFKPLFESVRMADIKLISSTYLSILIFTTIISFPILTLIFFLITLKLATAFALGFLGMIATAFTIYVYPLSVISSRKRKIKADLVFATVHMAAISGSGVHPTKIFKLLLESAEYKYLESELKKILNHINLFGYSLSTALRNVASQTPSYELKELLNGMVATIETGGELKKYLQDKADDSLNQYKLDQKKRLAVLNTFSDIYTGILVAAPLLFLVTLAILDKISPAIGGIPITTIAAVGTFIGIPIVNIGFILIINVTQPEI